MGISESVDGIIGEMIALKQVLRKTAPAHKLKEMDLNRVVGAIERCESLLRSIKEEVGV